MDSGKKFDTDFKEQRDDGPDAFREKQATKLIRFLRLTLFEIFDDKRIEDVLKDEESIKQLVLDISIEDYVAILGTINSVLRNKADEDFGSLDGEGVRMGNLDIFPEQEDKIPLLEKSLMAAKEMIKEKRSIEDIAILLSSIITAIHPFADGNGRTAKTILTLLLKGLDVNLLTKAIMDDGIYSKFVSSSELESLALTALDNVFQPSEQFPDFESYYESRECKRKKVEIMIEIILHESRFLVSTYDGNRSFTSFSVYKEALYEGGKFEEFRDMVS